MPKRTMTDATIHSYYTDVVQALCHAVADPVLSAAIKTDVDRYMQRCALAVFAVEGAVTQEHCDTINCLYSGDKKPGFLLLSLTAQVQRAAKEKLGAPPFFEGLLQYDKLLKNTSITKLFISTVGIVMNMVSGAIDAQSEAEKTYIANYCTMLTGIMAESLKHIKTLNDDLAHFADELKKEVDAGEQTPAAGETPAQKAENAPEAQPQAPKQTLEELLAELDGLVGLDKIKRDVRSLINLVKIRQLRKEQNLQTATLSLHLVFMGNPGTGKTTVARMLSKIYNAIGVLSKGQLVEVDRSGLVAGYVGQTAIKTLEVVKSAIGGVLFIDEAYALTNTASETDFGREAVETLLKAMEDNRNDLIVIVAGYSRLMGKFISSNPGLESRFNKYFYFEDYNGQELFAIFKSMCEKNQYQLARGAAAALKKYFTDAYANRDENFGNARDVRNAFESIVQHHSNRVSKLPAPTRENLLTIEIADVKAFTTADKEDIETAAAKAAANEMAIKMRGLKAELTLPAKDGTPQDGKQ